MNTPTLVQKLRNYYNGLRDACTRTPEAKP